VNRRLAWEDGGRTALAGTAPRDLPGVIEPCPDRWTRRFELLWSGTEHPRRDQCGRVRTSRRRGRLHCSGIRRLRSGGGAGLVHDCEPQPAQRRVGALGQRRRNSAPSFLPQHATSRAARASNWSSNSGSTQSPACSTTSASATSSHTRRGRSRVRMGTWVSAISSSRTHSIYRLDIGRHPGGGCSSLRAISSVRKPRSHR
jgi:hypothetical protein